MPGYLGLSSLILSDLRAQAGWHLVKRDQELADDLPALSLNVRFRRKHRASLGYRTFSCALTNGPARAPTIFSPRDRWS